MYFPIAEAQNMNEKDTIFLDEVIVNQKNTKKLLKFVNKGKKQKIKMQSVAANTIYANEIKINQCIEIQKITFYARKNNPKIENKETFELLFFSVGKDKKPAQKINKETFIFQYSNDEKIEIDTSKITISFCENFFIALQKTMENNNQTNSNYTILGNYNKNSEIFVKATNTEWFKINDANMMLDIYYTKK